VGPEAHFRSWIPDLLGLLAIAAFLADAVPLELLALPTIAAGGDTPCHFPTLVTFYERFLPDLRLHGWDPGAYLGHPLLLYYFPLPFLVMSGLAPATGLAVAFKIGSILGALVLPLAAYAAFRLMRFRFPAPLLGAGSATVFLFMEENPIWGGTLASTLTGEFAYAYGIALAVLFLGVAYRSYSRGDGPWLPAGLLGLTAFAHGYAVLWGGLSATFFLIGTRRPGKTLAWLLAVAVLSFSFAAVWLLPLLGDWGWTTPFNDAWISVELANLVPPYLAPLLAPALLGWGHTALLARRRGGADRRLLFLLYAAGVGVALAAAGPALGIIDVRFVPFAQLAAALAGGAALGLALGALSPLAGALAALGLLAGGLVYAESSSRVVRYWMEWNYTGLEGKELWPRFEETMRRLQGSIADPRATVEYSTLHERAGSIRMYEMLPYFTGRPTLEGVYNQASLSTHAVYYLTSELGERSPNPFRHVEFSRFDTESAIRHLHLFNTRDVVAVSDALIAALDERRDAIRIADVPPYVAFRLREAPGRYVEPLRYRPVRSDPRDWRAKAHRWLSRKPASDAHLVFTEDPRFELGEPDEWLAPPAEPLPGRVRVRETVREESIQIETDSPGHPLLVKVSYHPRWRAEGADGPYLVSPAMMLVVPRGERVTLRYARNAFDAAGTALSLLALLTAALRLTPPARRLLARRRERPAPAIVPSFVVQGAYPGSPRRWGAVIPALLVGGLCALRLLPAPQARVAAEADELEELARGALAEAHFEHAAEYARHAVARRQGEQGEARSRLLLAEALLASGEPEQAIAGLEEVATRSAGPSERRRALEQLALAYARLGDPERAESARARLLQGPIAFGSIPAGAEGDQVGEP
jgi:hypothetical protein